MRIQMRLLQLAMILLLGGLILSSGCGGKDVKRINGGGATFVDPIMQKWSSVYKDSKGIEIDYSKSGSGDGVKNMTSMTLDFGCSDAPMNKEQTEAAKAKGGDVVHIPLTAGAVAIVYNLPDLKSQLKLDGKIIGKIYLGELGANPKWNHPEIAALNLGVELPPIPIVPVYRAEGSGTSSIFTEFLHKSGAKIKASTTPKWPQEAGGTGQQGSDGVAGHVKNNVGCIGYVELTYAKKNNITFAAIKNRAGNDVSPDPDAVTAAIEGAIQEKPTTEPHSLHELTWSSTDSAHPKAYPISGMSYAVLYKKQPKDKGRVLVEFLRWATTEGQKFAEELNYAPLPQKLRDDIQKRLDQIELN
jgi:phosphate transport system substrate-binding protein